MIKLRLIVLFIACFLAVYLLRGGDKKKLREELRYVGYCVTGALILYWLIFILGPLFMKILKGQ